MNFKFNFYTHILNQTVIVYTLSYSMHVLLFMCNRLKPRPLIISYHSYVGISWHTSKLWKVILCICSKLSLERRTKIWRNCTAKEHQVIRAQNIGPGLAHFCAKLTWELSCPKHPGWFLSALFLCPLTHRKNYPEKKKKKE